MNLFNDDRVIIKPLKKFHVEEGDVLHGLKASEIEFNGFEEAYFSTIKNNKIKAWKRHLRMTMNLIVFDCRKVGFLKSNEFSFRSF